MKKGIKTLAMWLIIGVIVIVLLSSIMENSSSKMTYSELVTSISNKEVESIKISSSGSSATVKMKNDKSEKEVNIPSLDSFMSYTEEYLKTGDFTLDEEKESIWITILSLITPFGLLIIETKLNILLFFLIWILVFFVFICRLFFEFNIEVIYLLLFVISLFTSPSKLLTNIESNIVSCLVYSSLLHLICIPNNKRFSLYKPIKRVKRKLNKVKSS